jgi:hypothetical protein
MTSPDCDRAHALFESPVRNALLREDERSQINQLQCLPKNIAGFDALEEIPVTIDDVPDYLIQLFGLPRIRFVMCHTPHPSFPL